MSDRHGRRSPIDILSEAILDERAEKAEAFKKARREKLEMNVIELDDRNQAQALRHLGHLLGVCCGEIEGESKEMLAMWSAAHGAILAEVSEPTCKHHIRINFSHDGSTLYEIIIEREELV